MYTLIHIEYNGYWNRLIIQLLKYNERSLFGIKVSKKDFFIDLFYASFTIKKM